MCIKVRPRTAISIRLVFSPDLPEKPELPGGNHEFIFDIIIPSGCINYFHRFSYYSRFVKCFGTDPHPAKEPNLQAPR